MRQETLKRLGVPVFFLLVFLIPALFWDSLILQVSSDLIRRSIQIGRYVIGTCLWLTLAWFVIRFVDLVVWPVFVEQRCGWKIFTSLRKRTTTGILSPWISRCPSSVPSASC